MDNFTGKLNFADGSFSHALHRRQIPQSPVRRSLPTSSSARRCFLPASSLTLSACGGVHRPVCGARRACKSRFGERFGTDRSLGCRTGHCHCSPDAGRQCRAGLCLRHPPDLVLPSKQARPAGPTLGYEQVAEGATAGGGRRLGRSSAGGTAKARGGG
jgi:hypothetical protein